MKNRIIKIINVIERIFIEKMIYFNTNLYYLKYLKKIGININGTPVVGNPAKIIGYTDKWIEREIVGNL